MHLLIASVLAVCILIVFVSPVLNLPYTTLQSGRHALRVLVLLAIVAVWAAALALSFKRVLQHLRSDISGYLPADSLLEITCTRRC